jgi:hypothetical protein
MFGDVRLEIFPTTLPWNTARDTHGDAGSFAALLQPDDIPDIRPTMRLAHEKIRAGIQGWTNPELAVNPSFAFGKWKSAFTGLREEIHGRTPKPAAQPPRQGPVRSPSVGHFAATSDEPVRTGRLELP